VPAADAAGVQDRAAPTRPGAPVPSPPATPPDAGRGVAAQVAHAVQGSRESAMEIHLNPAELGKVRISLSPGENGMSVSIQAERPETLDLLRRHAEMLAQDFREMGYDSTSFSFGSRQGRGDVPAAPGPGHGAAPDQAPDAETASETRAAPEALVAPGRMDIRL
jgi:flagellar hook-length control protein FliK